ncbi:MAG: efflux RND transporter periplasmic adaptor subunit [Pikeienuella sp.]
MRFIWRSLLGVCLFLLGVGAAGYGAVVFVQNKQAGADGGYAAQRGPSERIFAVAAGVITPETIRPEIVAYGEIRSWRTLELRAANAGKVVELADTFRDGTAVESGATLFQIDPENYASAVADAEAALAEAQADLAEAEQAVGVAEREMAASETQLEIRESAMKRQRDLLRRGVATAATVEDAELSYAAAEQAAAGRAQALLTARSRVGRAALGRSRAEIALAEAERELGKTTHKAPFSGLLSDVDAVLGGLASANEKMGVLIDPTALEAAFRVTNAQFARLLDDKGVLTSTGLTVTLDLDDRPLVVPGFLDRADAVIGEGQAGRLVFAKLELEAGTLLRPGDFVTVRIVEPPLDDVARLPSSAVTEAGGLLLIDDDDRLTEVSVTILRRTGDDVIVRNAPKNARYVKERAPQLGRGVKVRIIGTPAVTAPTERVKG